MEPAPRAGDGTPPRPPGGDRAGPGIWLPVFALALIARLAFVVVLPNHLLWAGSHDSDDYLRMGRSLAEHGTYTRQTLRPPGYPTLIAAVELVFGRSLVPLRVVESVLGAAAIALLARLGAGLFGRRAGIVTGLLGALHPLLAFMPSTGFAENTSVVLMVLTLAAGFAAMRRPGLGRWAITGALIGVGTLTRANVFMFFPGFALGAAIGLVRAGRPWLLPLGVALLAMILSVAPWVARNHAMWGHWYISTGGGRQFYLGNNALTTGATAEGADPEPAVAEEIRNVGGTFAVDSLFYAKGWQFIREHPARAAQLYVIKLGNFFALYPDPYRRQFVNNWSRLSQGLASVAVFLGALVSLARWRREPAIAPLVLGTLSLSLSTAMVFSSIRYRLVIEPCLLLLAGLGWSMVAERLVPRRAGVVLRRGATGAAGGGGAPA